MRVIEYIKETKVEMNQVKWPSRKQAINYTVVVIVISLVVALFLGALDLGFAELLRKFSI